MPDTTQIEEKSIFWIKILEWIGKNPFLALAVLFAFTTGYLYIDGRNCASEAKETEKHLHEVITNMQKESLDYEKTRSSRLEFIIDHIPKNDTTK